MAPNHLHSPGKHGSPDPTDARHGQEPGGVCHVGQELGQVCRDTCKCRDACGIWAWDACLCASTAGCYDEHDQQCYLCKWYGQAPLFPGPGTLQPGAAHKQTWLKDPVWQGVRENVERLTATPDWAEQLFATNVIYEPLVGELFR